MGGNLKKILILFGGNSFEHEISCKSVNFVIKNIDKNLFDYKLVGIDFNNNWYEIGNEIIIDKNWKNNNVKLINNNNEYIKQFDTVFPVIHGNDGEDGKLQSFFELNNVNYVGCNSYTSLICYDKLLTKLILEKYDIPQIPYFIFNKKEKLNIKDFPVIVKPCKCGSSIGIKIANNNRELKKAIKCALKYDDNIIIEKYIKNKKELECAIIENKNNIIVSNIGEIDNNSNLYDFDSKYNLKTKTYISNIDTSIKNDIKKYSKNIFEILNCKKLSRIDFIYDNDNKKLYFNEINTIPGMTNISMYPILLENIGISNKELITILLS